MPTYNDTPLPTQRPSDSQSQIRDNFTQISNSYGTDHVAFTGSTQGYHKQITLNAPLAADPGRAGNVCSVYTKLINSVPQLFFQNSSKVEQLTGVSSLASNGYLFVGGIVIQWGVTNNTSGSPTTSVPVSFPYTFSTGVYSITANANGPGVFVYVNSPSTSGFTARLSSAIANGIGFYWMAIGI